MMTIMPSRIKPPVAARPNPVHSLADHLVGCWLLNEGAGQLVHDLSGQRHDGSFSGGTAWVPGAFGPAVQFDGNDDWISMGNCLDLGTEDITVLALVQYSAADQPEQWAGEHIAAIAGKGYLAASGGYGLCIGAGNKICWQVRNQSPFFFSVASNGVLNDGQWHMAIGVCDRDNSAGVRLYIDGVQQGATADPTGMAGLNITDPGAFAIGSRQDSGMLWAWDLLGRVAAVCVWKRVLLDTEINALLHEPFASFAQPRASARFTSPVGAIVDLSGSAQGVSSASATLHVIRGLSGVSAAHATATAVLRKAGSPARSGVRPRLRDVLPNGMTPTAFPLGTTLTQGWFWARHRGGAAVYRGPSLAEVDFSHILCVTDPGPGDIVLPAGLSHPPESTHCYVVRRFNSRGDFEETAAAATLVRLGSDGQLIPPAPNGVLGLTGRQRAGDKLQLTWFYAPLDQEAAPQEFRVYWDGGTGLVDWEHPLATVLYEGRRLYEYEAGPLDGGRYAFVVCPGTAQRGEAAWHARLVCSVTRDSPAAPMILGAEAV
jgi:hypothetical protein